jgi:hypothetical protein
MKKVIRIILTSMLFFILSNGFAQTSEIPLNPENNKIRFQDVIFEAGTKDEFFNRCINWLNNYYKDPVRVTSVRDQPSGKIIGKNTIRLNYTGDDGIRRDGPSVFYEFTIEMRDGRYRYTITDLLLRSASRFEIEQWLNKENPAYDQRWETYLDQIAEYVDQWGASLREYMVPEPEKVEDVW